MQPLTLIQNTANIDQTLDILVNGLIWALRGGKEHGDTVKVTEERMKKIRNDMFKGVLMHYNNPNYHEKTASFPNPPVLPTPPPAATP